MQIRFGIALIPNLFIPLESFFESFPRATVPLMLEITTNN